MIQESESAATIGLRFVRGSKPKFGMKSLFLGREARYEILEARWLGQDRPIGTNLSEKCSKRGPLPWKGVAPKGSGVGLASATLIPPLSLRFPTQPPALRATPFQGRGLEWLRLLGVCACLYACTYGAMLKRLFAQWETKKHYLRKAQKKGEKYV